MVGPLKTAWHKCAMYTKVTAERSISKSCRRVGVGTKSAEDAKPQFEHLGVRFEQSMRRGP